MRRVVAGLSFVLFALLGADQCSGAAAPENPPVGPHAGDAETYLPLDVGRRWILRSERVDQPIRLEVVGRRGDAYRVSFENPWSTSELWVLPQGGRYYVTGLVMNQQEAPFPAPALYWDFTASEGTTWKNRIGTLTLTDRDKTVRGAGAPLPNCVQVRESSNGNTLYWTFAPGVGFAQFGEGEGAFTLDRAASALSAGSTAAAATRPPSPAPAPTDRAPPAAAKPPHFLLGLAATLAAKQAFTPENVVARFEQSLAAGVSMIFLSPKWEEIEPRKGRLDTSEYDFWFDQASQRGLPIILNLRVIDTHRRSMPKDLTRKSFDDRESIARLERLVDQLAPRLRGTVSYIMIGNEIDAYFASRPGEVDAYVRLWKAGAERFKQHLEGVPVSATVTFQGLDILRSTLRALDDHTNFLALTYYPLNADFTMRPPEVVRTDFEAIARADRGRPVVMQEIGYSSSPICKSSEEQQSRFFDNVFAELSRRSQFIAANFFLMSDMSDQMVAGFGGYYGLANQKTFMAYLQYLGMFDQNNRPKASWSVFQKRGPQISRRSR
jgi:hypothetical protein